MRDDELRLACQHWKIAFKEPEKKEKPEACSSRQTQIQLDLKAAEADYYKKMREPFDDVQAWFFRK